MSIERPRFSGRKLPGIKTEVIGEEEAFAEGDRERIARQRAKQPQVVQMRMIGGPCDGATFPVPLGVLQRQASNFEINAPLPRYDGPLILPNERERHAIYRLDRGSMVLRYDRVEVVRG